MTRRAGLAPIMALIFVFSAGLATMKAATEGLERISSSTFLIAVLVGTLGAIVRRDQAPWLGFALFGWSYALVALIPSIQSALDSKLPTDDWVFDQVARWVHPQLPQPADPLPFHAERVLTGVYVKSDPNPFNLMNFQPTPEEAKVIDAYSDQVAAQQGRRESAQHAVKIAYAFAGLAFAFIGSALGRALANRSPNVAGSPEPLLSTRPG